jgi:hypothetical protein
VNGEGAFAGLVVGFTIGLIQYIVNLLSKDRCGEAGVGLWIACLHFNDFAGVIGVITAMVAYGVSMFYDAPDRRQLVGVWGENSYEEVGEEGEGVEMSAENLEIVDEVDEGGGISEMGKDRILGGLALGVLFAAVLVIIIYR